MRWVVNAVFSVLVVAAAVVATWLLVKTAPRSERLERPEPGILVETARIAPGRHTVEVSGMGTVVPAREVVLRPEVSGRITELHPDLVPGGLLVTGDVAIRVDSRDYQLAVEARKADVERARFELEVEQGRRVVAKREWELLAPDLKETEADRELALREPHLRYAEAALSGARSSMERAVLDLERTTITVPFNAVVIDESVEVGELVTPQTALATLAGTDRFWVRVSVPSSDLKWISLAAGGDTPGPPASIVQELKDGQQVRRSGRVVRLLGDLDPVGRMARLLVEIDDPLRRRSGHSSLPLLLGAYVRVDIRGAELEGVYAVPREAVRDGNRVWVIDADSRLDIRQTRVVWRGRHEVLVEEGLDPGDVIVTSPIANPVAGMPLRTSATSPEESESAGPSPGRAGEPVGGSS